MKLQWIWFLLPAVVLLTACHKNHHVAIPSPDLQVQNTSRPLIVQDFQEELKEQKQMQAEIAKLVKEIRSSKEAQRQLFNRMALQLDKGDVLVATSEAIETAINITVHNIANCKTTGYKKQRFHIQDGRVVETSRVWTQGNFQASNAPLDMVITGVGFFRIFQPNGSISYTRNGRMHLNRDGTIVTSDGDRLDPEINIPQDATGITIGSDGTVTVMRNGEFQPRCVGRIQLARFQDMSGLKAVGRNLFMETADSGQSIVSYPGENGVGSILTGFLEDSNVTMIEELMQLRTLQSWKSGVDQALMAIHERTK
jgi:flagellar basal body rod protein FlgG